MDNNSVQQLCIGTQQVIPLDDFKNKIASGRSLIIKLGADPTAPDLHLGHAVVLSKLRQFQDAGHTVIFLIGDFTARIGDPTGKSKTRPPLTEEQILHNTQTYFEQVSRILDPKKIIVRYNSEWLDKLSSREWIQLCAKTTLARLIEREDFANRLAAHTPIGFHELLYPILQGYDSVALQADVELGGTDQTFNLLMGRYLQEHFNQAPQVIMTVPLLPGLDGVAKMSKSLGNAIALTEQPDQVFGKIMSISDELMWVYYEILLHVPHVECNRMKMTMHPLEVKKQLAYRILERFWSQEDAQKGLHSFETLFQKKDFSAAQQFVMPQGSPQEIRIIELVKLLKAASSSSEARRLVEAGAVTIDGEKIVDVHTSLVWKPDMKIRVGKHKFFVLA